MTALRFTQPYVLRLYRFTFRHAAKFETTSAAIVAFDVLSDIAFIEGRSAWDDLRR